MSENDRESLGCKNCKRISEIAGTTRSVVSSVSCILLIIAIVVIIILIGLQLVQQFQGINIWENLLGDMGDITGGMDDFTYPTVF